MKRTRKVFDGAFKAKVGLSRSSWYSSPQGESAENLQYMRLIDKEYTRLPYYGIRKLTAWLNTPV